MELLMTESHMYLLDIKSNPSLIGQNNNREMSSIRLNLSTKTTWKLKTPGGILVFRLLVHVCPSGECMGSILFVMMEVQV